MIDSPNLLILILGTSWFPVDVLRNNTNLPASDPKDVKT